MKKQILYSFLFLAILFAFSSCATQSVGNIQDPPGFWSGLLHGFIILFSFIGSLFTDYEIYAFPNTGGWYNFGFLLGVMMFFGSSHAKSKKKKC